MSKGKHNRHNTTEYHIWEGMKQRCLNPNNPSYPNYGGRGIKISKRWLSFSNFYEDMGDRPSSKHSINRIDNDGDYCKANCEWADYVTQARNTTTNKVITYNGETKCLAEWAEFFGVPYKRFASRYQQGWSFEELTSDSANVDRFLTWDNRTQRLSQWAKERGINEETLRARLNNGWSVGEALSKEVASKNHKYQINGELLTLREIADKSGIKYATLWARLKKSTSRDDFFSKISKEIK